MGEAMDHSATQSTKSGERPERADDGGPQTAVVIGGGPAGLTAAWELHKGGRSVTVFEADDQVGGISRTVEYKGYRFDIGGHRFFTKVERVQQWWEEMLGEEFLVRPRMSRIYYNDKFFDYPLKPMNALFGLGPIEATRCMMSYAMAQLFPHPEEKNLEQWVSNRFGTRLYEIFFKTYTEKVWGMKCTEIGADWAAQRIKNLNLMAAVKNAFVGSRGGKYTSLIEEFHYPRLGPGMMWESTTRQLIEAGHPVHMRTGVVEVHHEANRVHRVVALSRDGERSEHEADTFISSMPVRELIRALRPQPPAPVVEAAESLRYRDFLTVGLIVQGADLFPDNWIYIHSPKVKVGRIQNFRSWSPYMVPEDDKSSLGLEYFVQEGDEVWTAEDADLIELGKREVEELGLVRASDVVDGVVIRMPKAYPVYDHAYQEALATIRSYLDRLENLQLVGRNGQHRYNNQDHSMMTAIFAAENVLGANHDVWAVNVEETYHEEKSGEEAKVPSGASGERLVPERVESDPVSVLKQAFSTYDPVAFGGALAVVIGLGLFFATAVLVAKDGAEAGANLAKLNNFLPGFEPTWPGAFIGLVEGSVLGFVLGYLTAKITNVIIRLEARTLQRRMEAVSALSIIDIEITHD